MVSNLDRVYVGCIAMKIGAEQLGWDAVRIQDLPLAVKSNPLLP